MDKEIIFLPTTDSTNEEVKRLANKGAKEGTIVTADVQTAGKGRKGRSWHTGEKTTLAMSFLLRPYESAGLLPDQASMVTLVAAVSVANAIKKTIVKTVEKEVPDIAIKWPNDIVINGKKVCGILTEMQLKGCDIDYVVVGIGVNVNQDGFPKDIEDIATSMRMETGYSFDRDDLLCGIMNEFEHFYPLFCSKKDLGLLKDTYEELLINKNREVKVLDPKGEYRGIALGIDNEGQLLVKIADGNISPIYAGEVSVRGLYGYV